MDAFELLKSDHKRVSRLFEETESASSQGKRQVFTRLKADLDLHAHIEEKFLYPALENTEEAREITLEAYEEHKVVKDLLAELAEGGEPDDEWDAKLTVLKENVEHHVEEEEGELFSKARKALRSEEIDRIGAEMEAEKARMQGGTAGKQYTSQARTRQSTKAAKTTGGQTGSATRSSSESKQPESPGVLKRIASFIGLGDSPSGGAKKSKKSAKTSGARKASPGTKAAKGKSGKSARKSAAKKSGGTRKTTAKSRTTGKTKSGGKTKSASKATTSRANKRQASSATRGSTKAASRPKKGKSRTSTKRSKTR